MWQSIRITSYDPCCAASTTPDPLDTICVHDDCVGTGVAFRSLETDARALVHWPEGALASEPNSVPKRVLCGPLGRGLSRLKRESYTTQSRFGSFTYKRFTVPQEVHRSAKRVSLFPLSHRLKKFFSLCLQRRPGRTSPPPPEAETVRPLMSCEPPQCSHVLLGMDNYSP
jgi:hypothetical protein